MGEQFVKIIMDYAINEDVDVCYTTIVSGVNKYLLSICPKYHSVMFPDSILTTENKNIITDISYANSIYKMYVCTMGVDILKHGDIIILYRTSENVRSAEYSAVAMSICVVDNVKGQEE